MGSADEAKLRSYISALTFKNLHLDTAGRMFPSNNFIIPEQLLIPGFLIQIFMNKGVIPTDFLEKYILYQFLTVIC